VASIADDVMNRRNFTKSLFNSAQYALSVLTAAAVYSALTGTPLLGPHHTVQANHLVPLLLAGVAMVAVNWLLVAEVVAIAMSQSLSTVLHTDSRQMLLTNLVLLSVGGLAAVVVSAGPGPLVLLAGPTIAAHLFAASAAKHSHEMTHDSLTGLENREQVDRALSREIASAFHEASSGPGLVVLDLDHFKDINDTLGHSVGDQILREAAARLLAAAPEGASVHRLGGDEFAVVVPGDEQAVHDVARALLASLDTPVQIEGLELLVRSSVGVAVAPAHGSDVETLMKNADIALYQSKIERDSITSYAPEFDVNTVERLRLLTDLRASLEAGDLFVVYQPQVDLADGRTVAVEALVRWQHPTEGLIVPDDFIPLAERSGLIFPVTEFVLDKALFALSQWRGAGHDLRMSVNLSARHLSDLTLVDHVAAALACHDIPPGALVLEVTETGILADAVRADVVIRSLRAVGVEIAIDDYGTGNASLSYLRQLQVDELKVDRSFVAGITDDPHDMIIVRSTVELALALGLRVVAEGVEDAPTAAALAGLGSVLGQGYHFCRPVSEEEIGARLREESRGRSTAEQRGS
ncbi:MAG: bifunctional diguanylate cyclase/phosphodiesterase, partial [Demequina sp.]